MDVKKVYSECGGDYNDVMQRLGTEERVERFVLKFLDNKDYDNMLDAIAMNDIETVFRTAHNLKGICLNLSFTELQKSSSELCELFRNGAPSLDYEPILDKVKADRERVVNAINNNI